MFGINRFLWCFIFLFPLFISYAQDNQFVVVLAGRNNKSWYKKNLDSIFNQTYTQYRVVYVDDNSSDGTAELVNNYVHERKQEERFTLIANKNRKLAMYNYYHAIHNHCQDSEIVVQLDADDWFAHKGVLAYLNKVYQDENIWMTYGNLKSDPYSPIFVARAIATNIIEKNLFRM